MTLFELNTLVLLVTNGFEFVKLEEIPIPKVLVPLAEGTKLFWEFWKLLPFVLVFELLILLIPVAFRVLLRLFNKLFEMLLFVGESIFYASLFAD